MLLKILSAIVLGMGYFLSPVYSIDLEAYELLEDLDLAFSKIKYKEWLKESKELPMVKKVFEHRPHDDKILPLEFDRFLSKEEFEQHFARDIKEANLEVKDWSEKNRRFVREKFHQRLVDEILEKVNRRKRSFFSIKGRLQHDSNVIQTPDASTQLVSNLGSSSIHTDLSFRLTGRELPFGQPTLKVGHEFSNYQEKKFSNRDSKKFFLKLSDKIFIKQTLSFIIAELGLSGDYLKSNGTSRYGFTTASPRMDFMFKPWRNVGAISDMLVFYSSLGFDVRTYSGVHRLDTNSIKKDSQTPTITAIFMNFKKWDSHPSRSTLSLNYRSQISESPDFTYDTYRAKLSYSLPYPKWTLTPQYSFSQRIQGSYLTRKRKDQQNELSLKLEVKVFKEKLNLSAEASRIKQNSNLPEFVYHNNRLSFEADVRF